MTHKFIYFSTAPINPYFDYWIFYVVSDKLFCYRFLRGSCLKKLSKCMSLVTRWYIFNLLPQILFYGHVSPPEVALKLVLLWFLFPNWSATTECVKLVYNGFLGVDNYDKDLVNSNYLCCDCGLFMIYIYKNKL